MPWSHCSKELGDDVDVCPTCGATKARWTMRLNRTRKFVIGARTLGLRLLDGAGAPVANEPYEVTLRSGQVLKGTLDGDGRANLSLRMKQVEPCDVSFPGRGAAGVGPRAPEKGPTPTARSTNEEPSRYECFADGSYVFELVGIAGGVTAVWEPDLVLASISAVWEPVAIVPDVVAVWAPQSLGPTITAPPFAPESLGPTVTAPPFAGEALAPAVSAPPFAGEALAPAVSAAWAA